MSTSRIVRIDRLPSGVPKLDDILGGGWPEFSFNLIVGEPGSGKTTLAHQFMFANASEERPALYFTVLGEPTHQDAALPAAVHLLRHVEGEPHDPFREPDRRSADQRPRPCPGGHRREGRCDRAAHRHRRFVPDARAAGRGMRGGMGMQEFVQRLATRPDVVAGHDVPARRVSRAADSREPGLHDGRRLDLADPASRPELDGAPGARCSRCAATARSRGCTPSASPATACRRFPACSSRSKRRRAMCRAN